jgi:nitrogen fixation/metabolism regulation signal transduction histidine kinase
MNRLRLNIGPRLVLCFALIIVLMFAGDVIVLWQFHIVQAQAERLDNYDEELVAVLRVHSDLLKLRDTLESLANARDSERLKAETQAMNEAFAEDMRRAKSALSAVHSDNASDQTILPILAVVQSNLQSETASVIDLAEANDWNAVQVRLANQLRPLEFSISALVERVDREVKTEHTQAAANIRQVQQRIFILVPATVVLTLLIAASLGLVITRSITQPLERLVEGSKMLARGEFNHRVPIQGEDELAQLGGVFNDTAQRLQDLYESLQSSEDRLRRVINTIPAHVWSSLPDGSVDFINQRWLESTGQSIEKLLGSGWQSIVHPDDRTRYIAQWRSALATLRGHPKPAIQGHLQSGHTEGMDCGRKLGCGKAGSEAVL